MRYIITGASGFIGQKLIEQYLKNGDEVIAVVRPNSLKNQDIKLEKNLHLIECDINQINLLPKLLKENGLSSNIVGLIHLAWMGTTGADRNNEELQTINIKNSLKALKVAEELHCQKFFFSGSQAEYGNILEHNYNDARETNMCYPKNEYGKAKLKFGECLERLEKTSHMKLYHGRIFSVYGPKDQPHSLIELMITNLLNGTKMELGPCEHDWNFTYIDDLAYMITGLLASNAPSGTYNLASKDTRQLKRFVEELIDLDNFPGMCEIGARAGNPKSDVPLRPNTDKLRQYVNILETNFKVGLINTMNYERERLAKETRKL